MDPEVQALVEAAIKTAGPRCRALCAGGIAAIIELCAGGIITLWCQLIDLKPCSLRWHKNMAHLLWCDPLGRLCQQSHGGVHGRK